MLVLKNVIKNYYMGDETVKALRGVSVVFRKSEFVSILGQSGCGKTTLLNIIGGLDKYTEGDLIINGVSTKKYSDRDWDNYRNLRVGFVFQSYNLIPHQTVLENVELALVLSGTDSKTRRKKAITALEKVGLSDQLNKKPNQLSGGQMQRVAIARAIVNDPEIILADEPTGALDSETSLQIMDILKELSKQRLVIMVTHNPELANTYSTRIIKLKDGQMISDSNSFEGEIEKESKIDRKKSKKSRKSHSMGIFTAIRLSLKNLLTKKARTFLTSFAGSIGIIGIALILSLSTGFNAYIDKVQRDTLSNYPITISKTGVDYTAMLESMMGETNNKNEYPKGDDITSNETLSLMFSAIYGSSYNNDLKSFKQYLQQEDNKKEFDKYVSDIQYIYDLDVEWYKDNEMVNDFDIIEFASSMSGGGSSSNSSSDMDSEIKIFSEMIDNQELLESQYDLLEGHWPKEMKDKKKANQAVLVVDNYNGISDYVLYNMGYQTDKLEYQILKTKLMFKVFDQNKVEKMLAEIGLSEDSTNKNYKFKDFLGLEYKILTKPQYYKKEGDLYVDTKLSDGVNGGLKSRIDLKIENLLKNYVENGTEALPDYKTLKDGRITEIENTYLNDATNVEIVGIVRKKAGVSTGVLTGSICYTKDLTNMLIENTINSDIYKDLMKDSTVSGIIKGDEGSLNSVEDKLLYSQKFGAVDVDSPTQIAIYPTSFENKDQIVRLIDKYNDGKEEVQQIKYSDYLGLMMSSITVIINAISYVLIAFVSISLIVSSIMIGIITYISVLERTKEIGVLRSLGASKKDISRVFNAETLIVGFVSGIMGIIATILLNIPITIIVQALAGITAVSTLPILGAVILVVISMCLTLISGLIPSRLAAKKDPVIALRTE